MSHDRAWLQTFRRRLLAWYRRNARDLPWRNTSDPYAVWVSEIMLQQTQVATVLGYYERFLKRFPTVANLAAAEEQEVLRYWEGLGYYRRARQMHRAARVIVESHGGTFPTEFDQVLALPGIGRYTAGAILSFAIDRRLPIVEANTQRLYARLLALDSELTAANAQRQLWQFAETLLPQRNPGELNQALIELGATICTPRDPNCAQCPLMSHCPTFERGLQEQIPRSPRKMKYESRHEVAIVIYKRNKVLIRQCQPGERWAGLWDFPRFAIEGKVASGDIAELAVARMDGDYNMKVAVEDHLTTIRHAVTKYRITLECYTTRWTKGRLPHGNVAWSTVAELSDYPLSVTGRKIARLIA